MCILYGGFLQSAFDLDGSSMIPAYENSRKRHIRYAAAFIVILYADSLRYSRLDPESAQCFRTGCS